jgi:hypothetical protein
MLFPNDESTRESYLNRELALRVCNAAHPSEHVSIEPQMLMALADGPGMEELSRQAVEATKRGTVAGDMMNLIYEMHGRGVSEPSFGKAIEGYKSFAPGKKYGDSEALKYSEQTLRNYFDEFRSVAHLWAAFRMNQGPYAYAPDGREIFHDEASLIKMLGVAKGIQEFASTFIPKRTKPALPIIGVEEQVKIPESIAAMRLVFKQS